eukprot:5254036-Amphidinium_carterae.1
MEKTAKLLELLLDRIVENRAAQGEPLPEMVHEVTVSSTYSSDAHSKACVAHAGGRVFHVLADSFSIEDPETKQILTRLDVPEEERLDMFE